MVNPSNVQGFIFDAEYQTLVGTDKHPACTSLYYLSGPSILIFQIKYCAYFFAECPLGLNLSSEIPYLFSGFFNSDYKMYSFKILGSG